MTQVTVQNQVTREMVNDAYTAMCKYIQGFPPALRNAWLPAACRTLEHSTNAERLAAIRVYRAQAQRVYESKTRRVVAKHIGSDFDEFELIGILDSLHLAVLRKVVFDNALFNEFCEMTMVAYVATSKRIDDLYEFAARHEIDLLGVNTDGLS